MSFRITKTIADQLEQLIKDEARPGENLSVNDMGRILMHEALEKRRKVRGR